MIYSRVNPGIIEDDDDEPFSLFEGAGDDDSLPSQIRALDAEIDEERKVERRVEAAQGRGGISPRVLQLAEPGLRGGLTDAQKLYAELGTALDKPTLGRQERRDMRDARRLLEDAWGVNALRIEMRLSKQRRFKVPEILAKAVRMPLGKLSGAEARSALSDTEPLVGTEPLVTLQAVASFGRKYVPRGRGVMEQRTELKGVYYGIDAQDKADRDYAQLLIDEGIKLEARLKDMNMRLVPSNSNRYERAVRLLAENKQQKKALVERRMKTVEDLIEMQLLSDDEVAKLRQAQKQPPRVRPPR